MFQRKFAKRASGCDLLGTPCALCDPGDLCEGKQLACYGDVCGMAFSIPYKKKRSVPLTRDIEQTGYLTQ